MTAALASFAAVLALALVAWLRSLATRRTADARFAAEVERRAVATAQAAHAEATRAADARAAEAHAAANEVRRAGVTAAEAEEAAAAREHAEAARLRAADPQEVVREIARRRGGGR